MILFGMDYVDDCLSWALLQLDHLFSVLPGFSSVLIALFFVFTIMRLLVAPLVGAFFSTGASDVVQKGTYKGAYEDGSNRNKNRRIVRESRKTSRGGEA